jgi:hypothetical protein
MHFTIPEPETSYLTSTVDKKTDCKLLSKCFAPINFTRTVDEKKSDIIEIEATNNRIDLSL